MWSDPFHGWLGRRGQGWLGRHGELLLLVWSGAFSRYCGHLILLWRRWRTGLLDGRVRDRVWSFCADLLLAIPGVEFFSGAPGALVRGPDGCAGFVRRIVGMFFLPFGLLIGPLEGLWQAKSFSEQNSNRPRLRSGSCRNVGGPGCQSVIEC